MAKQANKNALVVLSPNTFIGKKYPIVAAIVAGIKLLLNQ
jgi:hypothetical protein